MKPTLPTHLFVTGTGTGVGKTVASAVLVKALSAHYWKPVQTGADIDSDRQTVGHLAGLHLHKLHPEVYALQHPSSPHYAAGLEGIDIQLSNIINYYRSIPHHQALIIEGAGGILVPLNQRETIADLVQALSCAVVVVASQYLGSINHTLLTLDALQKRQIPIAGLVFNGDPYLDNVSIIERLSGVPVLGQIEQAEVTDVPFIEKQASLLLQSIQNTYHIA